MGRHERSRWGGIDEARELLRESESRDLTAEEIEKLRINYTGYGGLSSWNTDQHFTPPVVCRFIIDLLNIRDGKVLEPSCGSGAFIQELPDACEVTGLELMQEAAKVAEICNPRATIIQGDALELLDQVRGRYDWAIGNPPFAAFPKNRAPQHYELGPQSNRLEWYFVEMAYASLKPGGMLGLVVPNGTLSNPRDLKCRSWFLNNAWYRATISLPTNTFAFSGTSVKTSVIIMQKPLDGMRLRKDDYMIFMAMSDDIGWDNRRRETGKNDLPELVNECHEKFGGLDARHLAVPIPRLEEPVETEVETAISGLFDLDETFVSQPAQLSLF